MNIKIKTRGMSCLLGGDYERIYRTLSQLTGDCEGLFTERVPGNDYLQWELPGDGWIALSQCDQATGQEVRRQLDNRIDQVRQRFGANKVMADCVLSVPNDDYIFYKTEPDGRLLIALTAWGYCYPERVPSVDLNGILPELPQQESVNMLFINDGKPAGNVPIKFNGIGRTTDSDGSMHIGLVNVGSKLVIEDKYGRTHNVTVEKGSGQITIDLTMRARVIVCVEQGGRPKSGATVLMDYCGTQTSLVTGDDGTVSTQLVLNYNDDEVCTVTVDGQSQQSVLCEGDNTFSFILAEVIPEPVTPATVEAEALQSVPPIVPPLQGPENTPPEIPQETPPEIPTQPVPEANSAPKRTSCLYELLLALLILALVVGTYFFCSHILHVLTL